MQNRMLLSFALTFCLLCIALGTQGQQTITFHLDLKKALQNEHSFQSVGLRGSLPPLSWEKTTDLTDEDGDGIYTGTFTFPDLSKGRRVEYKYVLDGEMEFDPGDPRWWLSGASLEGGPKDEWNLYRAKTAEEVAQLKFSRAEVMADLAILEEALRTLHPGLYRYNDSLEMEERFAQLRQEISEYTTPGELYATLSRFTATIRCGHTYPNYFNQGAMVQQVVLRQPDKLPFTFQWFGDRMLTMDNASANEQLDFGAEIRSINGVPVAEIQQAILPMMKADGGNDGNRLHQMNLTGKGRYEAFDSYFPLLFPPVAGKFEINAKRLSDGQSFTTTVAAMKRTDRAAKIEEQKSAPASKAPWRLEFLAPDIAYLRMETFSTWEFDFDWKQWIATAFDEIREKNVAHLIVDIRNNEGGTTEVVKVLTEQIATTELSSELGMDRTRATAKPANLAPYLGTWEVLFETQKGNFEYVGNGFQNSANVWRNGKTGENTLPGEGVFTDGAFQQFSYVLFVPHLEKKRIGNFGGQ